MQESMEVFTWLTSTSSNLQKKKVAGTVQVKRLPELAAQPRRTIMLLMQEAEAILEDLLMYFYTCIINIQNTFLPWSGCIAIYYSFLPLFQHSCDPNLFLQAVFIKTRDIRFPVLAFFTVCLVKAGSELTFDYSYKPSSDPRKRSPCLCGSPHCRHDLIWING